MAILVAATFGFMAGAVYTSFKLAKEGAAPASRAGSGVSQRGAPQGSGSQGQDNARMEAEAGARILKLEAFLKENPDNAGAWVRLGNLFFDTSRFKDAIEAYERSLVLAPGNANVITDLGVMYRRNGNPEKAVQAFDRAIAADPVHETARFNKGVVLMHDLNDLPGAIKAWEGLLAVNPVAEAPNGQLVNTLVQGLKQKSN